MIVSASVSVVSTTVRPVAAEFGVPTAGNAALVAAKKKISVGYDSTCFIRAEGHAVCWGRDWNASLGTGWRQGAVGDASGEMGTALNRTLVTTSTPYQKPVKADAIFAGGEQTCVYDVAGKLHCMGTNSNGALGQTTGNQGPGYYQWADDTSAINLGTGRTLVDLASGGDSSANNGNNNFHCALLDNSKVKCWGTNSNGQLGLGDTSHRGDGAGEMGDSLPYVDLGTNVTARAVVAGFNFACAIVEGGSVVAGSVKCWGSNSSGQLGLGDTATRGDNSNEMGDNLPTVNLGTGRTAVAITAGFGTVCAVLDNGKVVCWGYNLNANAGRDLATAGAASNIGDVAGEMGSALTAVNLGTNYVATQVTAGWQHTCALLNDNLTLKCWGGNWAGQLGQGNTTNRGDATSTVATMSGIDLGLSNGETIVTVEAGLGTHTCVLTSSNRVKCWGSNSSGQLGLGDTAARGDAAGEMGANLPAVDLSEPLTATEVRTPVVTPAATSVTFSYSAPDPSGLTITGYERYCGVDNSFSGGYVSVGNNLTFTVTSTWRGNVASGQDISCFIRAVTAGGGGLTIRVGAIAGTPLTVTASSHAVNVGDAVPTITGAPSVSGVNRNGETCSTTYTTQSAPGSYPTTCSGGTANGYAITYVSGSVTVTHPAPTISGVNPMSSPEGGNTPITITGTGFRTGAAVSVGGVACGNVVVVSATSITCTVGARAAGAVAVVVTNTDSQSATINNQFDYFAAPTVTSVSPATGSTLGGTSITIVGTGFRDGATVTVGGGVCSGVSVASSTSLSCETPAGSGGTASVVVSNSDSQASSANTLFTYLGPSISPTGLSVSGTVGVAITSTSAITPSRFRGTVTFSATGLPSGLSISSSTGVISGTPTAISTATVTVTATGSVAGSASTTVTFSIVAAPATSRVVEAPSDTVPTLVNASNAALLQADPGEAEAYENGVPVTVTIVSVPPSVADVAPEDRSPVQVAAIQQVAQQIEDDLNSLAPGSNLGVRVENTDTGAEFRGFAVFPDDESRDFPIPIENVVVVKTPRTAVVIGGIDPDLTPSEVTAEGSLQVTAGGDVTAALYGYPSSVDGEIVMMSTPILLGKIRTGSDGSFVGQVTIPSDLPVGDHTIVLTTAGRTTSMGFKLRPGVLPTTGFGDGTPATIALWLLTGGCFVAYLRRRHGRLLIG